MPYGGTLNTTVSTDLIQTDVDAIIQGLSGAGANTLSDLDDRFSYLNGALAGENGSLINDMYAQIEYGLFDSYSYPFLDSLYYEIDNMLYDYNGYQPYLQSVADSLEYHLYDWGNSRPWLETISADIAAIRSAIEDVHDAAQHAFRTV